MDRRHTHYAHGLAYIVLVGWLACCMGAGWSANFGTPRSGRTCALNVSSALVERTRVVFGDGGWPWSYPLWPSFYRSQYTNFNIARIVAQSIVPYYVDITQTNGSGVFEGTIPMFTTESVLAAAGVSSGFWTNDIRRDLNRSTNGWSGLRAICNVMVWTKHTPSGWADGYGYTNAQDGFLYEGFGTNASDSMAVTNWPDIGAQYTIWVNAQPPWDAAGQASFAAWASWFVDPADCPYTNWLAWPQIVTHASNAVGDAIQPGTWGTHAHDIEWGGEADYLTPTYDKVGATRVGVVGTGDFTATGDQTNYVTWTQSTYKVASKIRLTGIYTGYVGKTWAHTAQFYTNGVYVESSAEVVAATNDSPSRWGRDMGASVTNTGTCYDESDLSENQINTRYTWCPQTNAITPLYPVATNCLDGVCRTNFMSTTNGYYVCGVASPSCEDTYEGVTPPYSPCLDHSITNTSQCTNLPSGTLCNTSVTWYVRSWTITATTAEYESVGAYRAKQVSTISTSFSWRVDYSDSVLEWDGTNGFDYQ